MIRNMSGLLKQINNSSQNINKIIISRWYSIYEPDYLDILKPKYPVHDCVNVQIKGYDYSILENYQKFIHRIGESMDLEVTDGWATPPEQYQIQRLKPMSTVVNAEYKLTTYDRITQFSDVPAPVYPILLRLTQAALPEGVTLSVADHSEDQEEVRYVPDRELIELKTQLDGMGGQKKK